MDNKIEKSAFMILIFILGFFNLCFCEPPSMGQIQKSQQDIEMEKALRNEIEQRKKVYIKKIIVKGATLITEDRIKEIIQPFKNHYKIYG